jgi:SAM-dependent methyltransferase
MLAEHLTQAHDRASRRSEIIDAHVAWIDQYPLRGRAARLLDLGCGPGLYTSRLAQRGHECVGIDYSPASIAYAEQEALRLKLPCDYVCQDIREAEYGTGFDLVMLIFGEFNAFRPSDAKAILQKMSRALADGGLLLLEPHTHDAVRANGTRGSHWYSAERGLFSDRPHLCLQEHSWDCATNTSTIRYFIVDAATADVGIYAQTQQAYSDDQYRSLLIDCGFDSVEFFPSLTGSAGERQGDLMAIVARKQAADVGRSSRTSSARRPPRGRTTPRGRAEEQTRGSSEGSTPTRRGEDGHFR